jgi:hypothetical protein
MQLLLSNAESSTTPFSSRKILDRRFSFSLGVERPSWFNSPKLYIKTGDWNAELFEITMASSQSIMPVIL